MTTIFDLKQNVSELKNTNLGISEMRWQQLAPTRDVTGDNFPNGSIHARWNQPTGKWWLPSKSYIRMRCSLTRADGSPLKTSDNIAPAMNLCNNLFQSAEFRIADKTVSRVSDYMSQISALKTRTESSKSQLDSHLQVTDIMNGSFAVRQSMVCADSKYNREVVKSSTSRADMGFDALNTLAIAPDTGVVTFAGNGGALPAVLPFEEGDGLEIDAGAIYGTLKYNVSAILSATTLQLNNVQTIALPAGQYDFSRNRESSDDDARNVQSFEVIYRPPLSIYDVEHALPQGKYELVLNPQNSSVYQSLAIESKGGNKVAGTDFKFTVNEMLLYNCVVNGPAQSDISYYLDLQSIGLNTEQLNAGQTSFQQRNFDVSPSTTMLTVAFQDSRNGADTRSSPSKFKVYNVGYTEEQELKLNRFFVNYASQNKPSPDSDPSFDEKTDHTVERYIQSQMNTASLHSEGGVESLQDWQRRGAYYSQRWPKEGTDRSTRVSVHSGFQPATDTANCRLCLFYHYSQVARVQISQDRVVDVQLEDV